MKKYIFIFIVALSMLSFDTFAQGIKFQDIKFEEALKLATKSKGKKLIFIDFYTSWCGPCKMMSEKIFPLKEVGKFMNEKFISLKIDAEKGDGIALAAKYGISSYPSMLIIDAEGKEVRRVIGYKNDYKEFLGRVMGDITDERLMELAKIEYEKDGSTANAMAYLEYLRKFKMLGEITAIVEKLYFNTPVENRYTDEIWNLVDDYIFNPESPVIKNIISCKADATSYNRWSRASVDKKLKEVYAINLLQALSNVGELTREQVYLYSDIINMLERPNTMDNQRSVAVVIAELMKLKIDNKIDDMLTILENEVSLLASTFYRIQTEVAFSEYKNLTDAQRARLTAYYTKVANDETAKGKELEVTLNEYVKANGLKTAGSEGSAQ